MHARSRMILVSAIAFAVCMGVPVAAQQEADASSRMAALRAAMPVDARLVVERADARETEMAAPTSAASARPRWVLPAIGAGIGLVAGVLQAHATMQGDYVGLPAEPMYLYPPAYAAAGALLGWLADAALRK